MTKRQLAILLRKVAARYFNEEPMHVYHGICWVANDISQNEPRDKGLEGVDAYGPISTLMKELGEPTSKFGPYTYAYTREEWEPRAWMCLILAAYLDGKPRT